MALEEVEHESGLSTERVTVRVRRQMKNLSITRKSSMHRPSLLHSVSCGGETKPTFTPSPVATAEVVIERSSRTCEESSRSFRGTSNFVHRTSGINLKLEQPPFGKFHFRDLPTFQPKSHFQRSHVPGPEGTNHIKNTTASNKIAETTRATRTHGPLLILFASTSHCAQASSRWRHSFKS